MSDNGKLEDTEAVVEQGLDTYLEVGQALDRIRRQNLYSVTGFKTWHGYLRKRWPKWVPPMQDKQHADDAGLIALDSGMEVGKTHAQELARLHDPADVPRALEAAKGLGGLTHKYVKQAVDTILRETHKPPHRVPLPTEEELAVPSRPTLKIVSEPYRAILSGLEGILEEIKGIAESEKGYYVGILLPHLEALLEDARGKMVAVAPGELCATCMGHGCQACFETGFINVAAIHAKQRRQAQ